MLTRSYINDEYFSFPIDDFKEQVKRSLNLPANYNTVYNRAQLAQKIYEKAKDEIRICETLVYEQHLQQQGCKYRVFICCWK